MLVARRRVDRFLDLRRRHADSSRTWWQRQWAPRSGVDALIARISHILLVPPATCLTLIASCETYLFAHVIYGEVAKPDP